MGNGKLLKASYAVNWHSGQPMTAKLTFYGGVNEIGGKPFGFDSVEVATRVQRAVATTTSRFGFFEIYVQP